MALFVVSAACEQARADAVTFEATVNSARVSLDEALQLTLTITGVNQDLDPINLPVLDGFSAKYVGPSTSVSIINGDYHSERSFIYNLFPNKAGHFQIPAISATIAGQTYTTKPIDVDVLAGPPQGQAPGPAPPQGQAPSADSLKDKVLIMVSADKAEVYLGQAVTLSIKLLVNAVPMRDIQLANFDKQGFLMDAFEKPEQGAQVYNGIKYDTVEYKTKIYPNQLGDLQIGPIQIQGNIIYKTGQNNPFGQENDFFGGNFFNNFFDTYAARPATINSEAIHLHVLALPQANKPQDFTGAIGQFDFQASAAPAQVKAGDPLTLKMDIKGSGNFKSFKMPVFQAEGFKTYEPKIKDTGDEKTAEEVIIPTAPGTKEVPALNFSYFDTSLNDYKTLTQGPFPITVSAPNPDQDFKAVGFADMSKEPAVLAANTLSLGKIFKDFLHLIKKLLGMVWFWTVLGVAVAGATAYFIWKAFQERLENDPAFARRLKAVREAKKALAPAEGLMGSGRLKDFYGLISKVLKDYLANKWHLSSPALSVMEITGHLAEAKIDQTLIDQIKSLLEAADLVCFAGASRDMTQMRADLAQTQDIIARLEKAL